ncbi:MAG: hypothetical protein OEV40_05410 [Acidimicrobiia bacterium]|nr:hypothetical protein [Acidimicrobiia bacterium]
MHRSGIGSTRSPPFEERPISSTKPWALSTQSGHELLHHRNDIARSTEEN